MGLFQSGWKTIWYQSIQLHWNMWHMESVQLRWNTIQDEYFQLRWNLSNCVGILFEFYKVTLWITTFWLIGPRQRSLSRSKTHKSTSGRHARWPPGTYQVGKLSDINVSKCIEICPTMLESVQLRWDTIQDNLSNCVGICPITLESVQLRWNTIQEDSVQLRWNLSNCVGMCPITLEYYSNFTKSSPE